MKSLLIIFGTLALLASCKPEAAKPIPFTFNKEGGAPIKPTTPASMILVSPSSSPGFIASPTVTLSGLVVGEAVKVYRDSTCVTLVGSMTASSSSMTITLQSLPVGTHQFYTKTTNSFATSACSSALLTYQFLGVAPLRATSITLITPATSPGSVATPTVQLSGVRAGETSRVFVDSACATSYGSAVAGGTTVTITTVGLAPGTHQFYTNATNTAGTSGCSSNLLTYQYTGVMPTPATGLSLTDPQTSPNYDATPTVTLTGVANGDTVRLYTDSGCSTQVASGVAGIAANVVLTTSTLAIGSYNFYSSSTNVVGTSSCSASLGSYTYSGPPPTVAVSWTANREYAVNSSGGGYRVYYSRTNGFDPATATYVDVAYVSGPQAPTTVNFTNLLAGVSYFRVQAYSALNAPGATTGSRSSASAQFSVTIP